MTQPARPSNAEHPVALGSFRSWMRLLRSSEGIDRAYLPRALFVSLTTLLTSPLRAWERVRYGRQLRRTPIHPSPIFIVGHWRSGTTHLHNLLCQDENLSSLTTFQALAPGFCLVGDGAIKRAIAKLTAARYPTRLIDNVPLDMDAPQEDEFGLANLSEYSYIHTFSFPRQADEIFRKSVLLDGLPAGARKRWIASYLELQRKASLASGGRRQVVKNCAHSARIPILLEHFPEAKFVHIHRNPYKVFPSVLHMLNTVLLRSQLQQVAPERLEALVLRSYVRLMERFLADRSLIPEGNLAELRFDDLQDSPIDELCRIYEELGLPGFAEAEPRVRTYLDSVADYRKNIYDVSNEVIRKVNDHWSFAFDAFGYERLVPRAG
jgi:hypothetical protein